jgi:hypothetical protein
MLLHLDRAAFVLGSRLRLSDGRAIVAAVDLNVSRERLPLEMSMTFALVLSYVAVFGPVLALLLAVLVSLS